MSTEHSLCSNRPDWLHELYHISDKLFFFGWCSHGDGPYLCCRNPQGLWWRIFILSSKASNQLGLMAKLCKTLIIDGQKESLILFRIKRRSTIQTGFLLTRNCPETVPCGIVQLASHKVCPAFKGKNQFSYAVIIVFCCFPDTGSWVRTTGGKQKGNAGKK